MYDPLPCLSWPRWEVAAPSPAPGRGPVRKTSLRTLAEVPRVLEAVVATLAGAGYSSQDQFAVRLALEEAVVNAIKHGHGFDPTREVRVLWEVTQQAARLEVEDEGPGFDPTEVPDPRQPENLDRPCGRGLLLMRHFLTRVEHRGRGNRVLLFKQRSQA